MAAKNSHWALETLCLDFNVFTDGTVENVNVGVGSPVGLATLRRVVDARRGMWPRLSLGLVGCSFYDEQLRDIPLDELGDVFSGLCDETGDDSVRFRLSTMLTKLIADKDGAVAKQYIVHRAYGLPFTTSAQMIDRDTIFVPAGWDSEKKIEIVRSNITEIDVLEPNREKVNVVKEPEVIAEDTQVFLARFADMLAKDSATNGQKKVDEAGATASDSPLASFFSNLLKDKPQSTRTAAPVSEEQQQAQIEKIFQKSDETDSAA
ncbi:unnamed protein product, partial [Mesorhabditis spiculigera]